MAPYTRIAALTLLPLASAHMMLHSPTGGVWGQTDDNLEDPLNAGTKNWFCHGKTQSDNPGGQVTFTAGESTTIPVICGDANKNYKNAVQTCTDHSAFHDGGGCGLSILYKNDASVSDLDDFVMFSVNADCPNGAHPVSFDVPADLPATDNAVCTWTWIPNPDAANSEMYMNCFDCKVVSKTSGSITGGIKLKDHLWAVSGAPNGDEAKRMYKDSLPNGALSIEVDGKSGSAPSTPPSSPDHGHKKPGKDGKKDGKDGKKDGKDGKKHDKDGKKDGKDGKKDGKDGKKDGKDGKEDGKKHDKDGKKHDKNSKKSSGALGIYH